MSFLPGHENLENLIRETEIAFSNGDMNNFRENLITIMNLTREIRPTESYGLPCLLRYGHPNTFLNDVIRCISIYDDMNNKLRSINRIANHYLSQYNRDSQDLQGGNRKSKNRKSINRKNKGNRK